MYDGLEKSANNHLIMLSLPTSSVSLNQPSNGALFCDLDGRISCRLVENKQ